MSIGCAFLGWIAGDVSFFRFLIDLVYFFGLFVASLVYIFGKRGRE